jgi:pilus assembly protein CpaC
LYSRQSLHKATQIKRLNMDTFSPVSVPVSSRLRRITLASASSLVAFSLFVALPVASARQAAHSDEKPASGAFSLEMPQSSLTKSPGATELFSATPVNLEQPLTTVSATQAIVAPPELAAAVAGDAQSVSSAAQQASVKWTPTNTARLVTNGLSQSGGITLSVNRTSEIKTNSPVKRVSVGQPDVADIQAFADNLLLVTAKKAGTTQVILWDEKNQSQSIDINVEIPLDQLKDLIGKLAPGSNIDLSVANDTIVLRGQAPNLTVAKQIGDVAGAFGKTQNFIEVAGGQTVAVQVQFAEVSRSVTNSLGVNWGFQDGSSIFGLVPGGNGPLSLFAGDDGFITNLGITDQPTTFDAFGTGSIGGKPFAYFIKALRENNLLRVLQEPNLTTTSGEPASFLAGGQVAVPVPTDSGNTAIEYKEFGIRLLLTPIVLGNGKIRLIMEAESSDLDYTAGTTIQSARVPGLRTRRVQSTVEIAEGATMSVAGLLDDSVLATRQSIPGLGDLPVLGQLFRSTRYQRKETELVILITPRLSGAMNPDQVTALPGANWRHPNELEQAFLGDLGGNAEADATRDFFKKPSERGLKPADRAPRTEGSPLAAGNPTGASSATAENTTKKLPAPLFIGEHGFTPVRDASVESSNTSDTASVEH